MNKKNKKFQCEDLIQISPKSEVETILNGQKSAHTKEPYLHKYRGYKIMHFENSFSKCMPSYCGNKQQSFNSKSLMLDTP